MMLLLLAFDKCRLIWEFTLNHLRAFTQSLKVICLPVWLESPRRGVLIHFYMKKQLAGLSVGFSLLFCHCNVGCSLLFWYPFVTWIFTTPRFRILGPGSFLGKVLSSGEDEWLRAELVENCAHHAVFAWNTEVLKYFRIGNQNYYISCFKIEWGIRIVGYTLFWTIYSCESL